MSDRDPVTDGPADGALAGGWLADRYGSKRVYMTAIAIFTASSAASAACSAA
mgnify:CR=1 FL=1